MRLGIIGLGLVGQAMAKRLLAEGHEVCGYDLAEGACGTAQALGVEVCREACLVAGQIDTLFLSLMTSENRRALLWGEQAAAQSLRPGTTILDTTTARPEDIREDHTRLAAQDVRLIDVCLSGSSQDIAEGNALALVGDTEQGAAYAPLLSAFTKAQYYFGAPGKGNEAKLIVNLVMGLNRLVLAEALGLASKAGFELEPVLEVLKAGGTYSAAMDTKGPKMIAGAYEPAVARLAQHAKDVALILEYARSVDAEVPVSEVHEKIIRAVAESGAGALDNAAIFEAYSERKSL